MLITSDVILLALAFILWCAVTRRLIRPWRGIRFRHRLPLRLATVEVCIVVLTAVMIPMFISAIDQSLHDSTVFAVGPSTISDWPEFSNRLVHHPEKETSPSSRLWELLSDDARQAFDSVAEQGQATSEQKDSLAESLNQLLENPELYDREAFLKVPISDHFRTNLEKTIGKLSNKQVLCLQRLILEAAYPDLVTKSMRRQFAMQTVVGTATFFGLLLVCRFGLAVPFRQLGIHSALWFRFAYYGVAQAIFWTPIALLCNLVIRVFIPQPTIHLAQNFFAIPQPLFDWFLLAINVVILAPLAEELFFRGILQSWMSQRVAGPIAIFVTAVLFGLAHHSSWPDPIPLTVLGIGLGITYQSTRSLWSVVAFHATFNAFNLLALTLGS